MKKNKTIGIFVPGRVSIIGELSDWVSDYKKYNDQIIPGEVIAMGIDKGIYANASKSSDFIFEYNNQKIKIKDMKEIELDKIARSQDFFSYVASVALYMKRNYNVSGINIKVMYMTLPIKKGLSSSACVSVLVAKAFNLIYNLNLNFMDIMEIAYKSERYALSMCGRLDQICAKGLGVSHIIFNENDLVINPVRIKENMHMVICDVNGFKDTKNILNFLHSCFPIPKTKEEENVKRMLCEDNKIIIDNGLKALEKGDIFEFGKIMTKAQVLIDESAGKICKDLEGPRLHEIMNDKFIKEMSYGAKGIGSNGDGAIEILAKDKLSQESIINYLKVYYHLNPFKLDINKTYKIKKAVIPVSGFGTRVYPFTRTIKKSFLPVVDGEFVKPLILKLVEDLDKVGIEEILLIIGRDEEEIYSDFFKKPLSIDHFESLTDEQKEYELNIIRLGEKIIFKVQEEKLGYGHAVLESREFAGNDAVLMILGDTIYKSNRDESCIGQVLGMYDKLNKPIISLHELSVDDLKYYGIAKGNLNNNLMKIEEIIEKPSLEVAEKLKVNNKYYGTFGISIINNSIYDALSHEENKEMEFTKAIDIASKKGEVFGYVVDGYQFDLGNPISYQKTMKEFNI